MQDILERLRASSPDEGSDELFCRCLDAYAEIERLRGNYDDVMRRAKRLSDALSQVEDLSQQLDQIAARALYGENAS